MNPSPTYRDKARVYEGQTDAQLWRKAAIEDCHLGALQTGDWRFIHDEVTKNYSSSILCLEMYCIVGFQLFLLNQERNVV